MANVLIKLATTMLLITVGRIMGNRGKQLASWLYTTLNVFCVKDTDGSGVASVSISLLVGLHEQCTANSEVVLLTVKDITCLMASLHILSAGNNKRCNRSSDSNVQLHCY